MRVFVQIRRIVRIKVIRMRLRMIRVREARHGPQDASSAIPSPLVFILRPRHIQASGIFGGARRGACADALPAELWLRRKDLVPEGVEVAVPDWLLKSELV